MCHHEKPLIVLFRTGMQQLERFVLISRVKISSWLIGQQQSRACAERSADCCALSFPVRKIPGKGVPVIEDAEVTGKIFRYSFRGGVVFSRAKVGRKENVVTDR